MVFVSSALLPGSFSDSFSNNQKTLCPADTFKANIDTAKKSEDDDEGGQEDEEEGSSEGRSESYSVRGGSLGDEDDDHECRSADADQPAALFPPRPSRPKLVVADDALQAECDLDYLGDIPEDAEIVFARAHLPCRSLLHHARDLWRPARVG